MGKLQNLIDHLGPGVEARITNPLVALDNAGHAPIDATVVNTTDLVADILDPVWMGIKNIGNIVNYNSYKRNGAKNIVKAPTGALIQFGTAIERIFTGLASGTRNLYRRGVQDNVRHFLNGSVESIPGVGPLISRLADIIVAAPGLIPATLDGITRGIDHRFYLANNALLLEGQNLTKSRMGNPKNEAVLKA